MFTSLFGTTTFIILSIALFGIYACIVRKDDDVELLEVANADFHYHVEQVSCLLEEHVYDSVHVQINSFTETTNMHEIYTSLGVYFSVTIFGYIFLFITNMCNEDVDLRDLASSFMFTSVINVIRMLPAFATGQTVFVACMCILSVWCKHKALTPHGRDSFKLINKVSFTLIMCMNVFALCTLELTPFTAFMWLLVIVMFKGWFTQLFTRKGDYCLDKNYWFSRYLSSSDKNKNDYLKLYRNYERKQAA